jgi:hypothetical protein
VAVVGGNQKTGGLGSLHSTQHITHEKKKTKKKKKERERERERISA